MEADKIEYKGELVDMKDVVDLALMELDALIKAKDIKVCARFGDCTGGRFRQTAHDLGARNFLSNAIKFSAPESEIAIELSKELAPEGEPKLRCSVIDEGPGIPDKELKTVFDEFVQSTKTKTGAGGTGLGLAICRNIVKAHGGRIWAENGTQKGAILTFVIPQGLSAERQAA